MASNQDRGTRRVLERLSDAECVELISNATVDRLVYTSRYGPVALPFEYKMHDGSIVFRTYRAMFTEEDLRTDIPDAEYGVVVEIDQTDTDRREGWIVIVQGQRITWTAKQNIRRSPKSASSHGLTANPSISFA